MTIQNLLDQVLLELQEPNPSVDFPNATIVNVLNDEEDYLCEVMRCLQDSFSVTSTANTSEYTLNARVIDVISIQFSGVYLDYRSIPDMDRMFKNWRQTTGGTPVFWGYWDSTKYFLYPKPSTTTADAIVMNAYVYPSSAMSTTVFTGSPSIHRSYHRTLAGLAAYHIATIDAENESMLKRAKSIYEKYNIRNIAKRKYKIGGRSFIARGNTGDTRMGLPVPRFDWE